MFGVGWTEILLVLIVALLVLGPTKLPDIAKGLGKGIRDFKKAMSGLAEDDPPPPRKAYYAGVEEESRKAMTTIETPPPPEPPRPPPPEQDRSPAERDDA